MSVELTTLSNGFRVVTDRMDGLESATLGIWVAVGARYESESQGGVSHFLEHMAFKGTATRSAYDIANAIESVGGFINAYTSREVTAYHARVLRENVPLAIEIVADILRSPTISAEDVEVERGVILQEIGQCLDSPEDQVADWLYDRAWPEQAMGRPVLGSAERVRAFQPADLRGYMDAHYRPGSMVLAAAGAVDHAAVVEQAKALFGDLESDDMRPAPAPGRFRGGDRCVEKDLEQVHLALALEGAGNRDPDRYAARVFAMVLGGNMTSRLFQEARERRGLCYGIYAHSAQYVDTGMVSIHSGTSEAQLPGLIELVADEIRRLAQDATPEEVDRVRTQMRSSIVMGLESSAARCERLASNLLIHGRVVPIRETIDAILAVDATSARAAGERMVEGAGLSYVLYGNVGGAPEAGEVLARISGASGAIH